MKDRGQPSSQPKTKVLPATKIIKTIQIPNECDRKVKLSFQEKINGSELSESTYREEN